VDQRDEKGMEPLARTSVFPKMIPNILSLVCIAHKGSCPEPMTVCGQNKLEIILEEVKVGYDPSMHIERRITEVQYFDRINRHRSSP
jgi:hypothetical protein